MTVYTSPTYINVGNFLSNFELHARIQRDSGQREQLVWNDIVTIGYTSFTRGSKMDEVAPDSTESIDNDITTTSLRNVLGNLLRSGTEPALWRWGRERERERERESERAIKLCLYMISGFRNAHAYHLNSWLSGRLSKFHIRFLLARPGMLTVRIYHQFTLSWPPYLCRQHAKLTSCFQS